ncbi:hypothetical protein TRVL_08514 [Trypanosoma vivax]|nr:hypothetical protein TRVL_08514 [Trypanosoma vivax]
MKSCYGRRLTSCLKQTVFVQPRVFGIALLMRYWLGAELSRCPSAFFFSCAALNAGREHDFYNFSPFCRFFDLFITVFLTSHHKSSACELATALWRHNSVPMTAKLTCGIEFFVCVCVCACRFLVECVHVCVRVGEQRQRRYRE